ncbi:MAG: hypothetical protein DI539_24150 [Flavobacterium psychrophilum]|nr:MAG: hypothetical protein DI539_24150 [Flavobacterium psychrophilum]
MKNELPFLSDSQWHLVQETLNRLVDAVRPEKIVCYGIRSNTKNRWSSFQKHEGNGELFEMAIDLLIVTHEKDKRKRDGVLNITDSLSSERLKIIAVVHSIEAVVAGLNEGNSFFINVLNNGIILYDQNQTHYIVPNEATNLRDERRLVLAKSFYQTACECVTTERFEIAAFLFHQAVEQSCAALLTSRLGYRPTTHSIKRLLSLTENITSEISELFSSSSQDDELLDILHRSYTEVRYKESYEVSTSNTFKLMERVSVLQDLVIGLCADGEIQQGVFDTDEQSNFYDLDEFESITVNVTADIVLHKGEKESIRFDTGRNAESLFLHSIENKKLTLSIRNSVEEPIPYTTIHITYSSLKGLVVDESGILTCTELINSESLGIVQNGKGEIDLKIDVLKLGATVAKTGGLKLSGTADQATILSTGSGNFNGTDLEVSECQLRINDAGDISVFVEDELSVDIRGSGKLKLKGEPRIKKIIMI